MRYVVRGDNPEVEPAIGDLLRHVELFERAKRLGFTLTMSDVNLLEFQVMSAIDAERDAWREEQQRQSEIDAAHNAFKQQAQQSEGF